MFTSGLIGKFGKTSNKFFENVSHLIVTNHTGMKIHFDGSEFTKHLIEQSSLIKSLNHVVEVVGFHHLPGCRGKRFDIVSKVPLEVVGVIK